MTGASGQQISKNGVAEWLLIKTKWFASALRGVFVVGQETAVL